MSQVIRTGLDAYMDDIGRFPLLKSDEFLELIKIVRECWLPYKDADSLTPEESELKAKGLKARNRIIECNMRLAVRIITKDYQKRGIPFEDLLSEASKGLAAAAEKYDPATGNAFSTFAYWQIKGVLSRVITNQGRTIRVPVGQHETYGVIRKFSSQFLKTHGRSPSISEVAQGLGLKVAQVETVLLNLRPIAPLNFKVGEDTELGDLIGTDPRAMTPMDWAIETEQRELLNSYLDRLGPLERQIVEWRSGLTGEAQTFKEISKRVGRSKQGIINIFDKAIEKLQQIAIGSYVPRAVSGRVVTSQFESEFNKALVELQASGARLSIRAVTRQMKCSTCAIYSRPDLLERAREAIANQKPNKAPSPEVCSPQTLEQKKKAMSPTKYTESTVDAALATLKASKKPFTIRDVSKRIGSDQSGIYRHPHLVQRVKDAIASMEIVVPEAHETKLVQPDPYIQKLEEEINRLRNEKAQLQLQAQIQPQQPISGTLRQERDRWIQQLATYRAQQQELEIAIAAATNKIEVLDDLIESAEAAIEVTAAKVELLASSNGHHKAVAIGGAT